MLLATDPRSNSRSRASSSPASVNSRDAQERMSDGTPQYTSKSHINTTSQVKINLRSHEKKQRIIKHSFCHHNFMSCPLIKDTQGVFVSSEPWLWLGAGKSTHSRFAAPCVKPALPSCCASVAVAEGYKQSATKVSSCIPAPCGGLVEPKNAACNPRPVGYNMKKYWHDLQREAFMDEVTTSALGESWGECSCKGMEKKNQSMFLVN